MMGARFYIALYLSIALGVVGLLVLAVAWRFARTEPLTSWETVEEALR